MLVYIAAPLGDPDPAVRAWHRERANLLAALAFAVDYVPVCVHTYAELATGADTDPEARARGLERSMRALERINKIGGELWALLRDDGTRSPRTFAELDRWDALRAPYWPYWTEYCWQDWRKFAERSAPHLLPEFDRLAVRPIAPARADGTP